MNRSLVLKIVKSFSARFEETPLIVQSPGRINIIGEHTDYNDGFVLPAAINKYIVAALSRNTSDRCSVYS
ncbi:MAG: galactokinase family protein, partial [Bacteroidia bacterium]|nr:galactokinase family protein [Bacteroidia bacterium]